MKRGKIITESKKESLDKLSFKNEVSI
jgi:hypothetical protein